ncbi:lysosomal-trafficking regulator isoform X3 [Ooceraea biroi]|uniref:lysosomal-trafficking regulator isoform X3 n=1 Tax=Ooceraea biroi TaxID=2015173 RepID=UPI000F08C527|nr:lysosomal-trafficking regulator isoform X3 [Ooceraea biroi]XP_011343930.2 lysosomal-trafficking regulator isoform X3 [Ooceraea biroi]XP_011343932.2 lysosomal-trafficking regulator isoform X3 [Ooceraea biroi]XP_011343934.2 lysosomal-trafficking regulator isoform X3 [Ooceraea biroi]XP_011343935.2 lysosomal-trafficking regulator isoform X3 [Ooceraea biroi]XP_011343938.2 lysosomal-trafficking regulator isoform X3 [Ooceraea biroi]XP_011343939.2 lysosomal-trafficking regulator isoform X3 [Oocera
MQTDSCRFTQFDMRNLGLSGDQVTWSKDARQRQHEDTLYAWLSFDEVASYEEDARLKTEDLDEEDEKEREECSGMSTASANKLQILWDHFIHAEPQSYEKSSWLDIFLAELLAQIKEGKDVKDALSFCSVGGGGVSTLVACELLSDVHELCGKRNNGDELVGLRKYLVQDRGWRCLAALHLLGVRGLSCGRELVALLVALYPVALQERANSAAASKKCDDGELVARASSRNQYVRFHCNDDTVDTVDIVLHARRKSAKGTGSKALSHEDDAPSRRRFSRRHVVGATKIQQSTSHKQRSSSLMLEARRSTPMDVTSSESEQLTDAIDQARSLTLKIRLNPMDFEYFTSIVRSDEEQKWQAELYELPQRPVRKTQRDYIDERIQDVLDANISNFEISLLIIQLLQGLRDYDTPAEQTPAVQVLKFALDTLWSLQFGIDGNNLSVTERATLKAAAARLMLTALERALRADEPTTAVIHNGLLPMTLRLLEDACSKPVDVLEPEEGSLLQEFIFATIYGIVTFLYCLLHQRGSNVDKLSDFLELFRLFVESQDGKLVERTVFAIVDLPSIDPAKSIVRAKKIIDMIGALTSSLKRIRRDLSHVTQCHRTKHRSCIDSVQSHHHSDVLGTPYSRPILGIVDKQVDKQVCCISSLFATLTNLLKESHLFVSELRVRLIKITTAAGTCCCFPPRMLVSSIVAFLRKRDSSTYASAVAFLERTLFKELGAYPATVNACNICDRPANYSWDFLEVYADLLCPSDPKLCYVVMAHLLKVTPGSRFHVREQLLLRVFYPTFLRAKVCYASDSSNATAKFLIQSCMSVMSCLIVNAQMCEKFMEINALREILPLMVDTAFTRSVYALLEVTVTIEIWKLCCEESSDPKSVEAPATESLFESLDRETDELLKNLRYLEKPEMEEEKADQQSEKDTSDTHSGIQKVDLSPAEDIRTETDEATTESLDAEPKLPESDIHHEQLENKTDTIDTIVSDPFEKLDTLAEQVIGVCKDADASPRRTSLHQASSAWRAAAGVALYSPKFRVELSAHPVSKKSLCLFKLLTIGIATDSIEDTSKSAHKLFEALITCCLTSPLYDCDIVMELGKTLMETGVTLGRGLAVIVDAMLKVSMLKPAQENCVPQQPRPRLPTMMLETLPDCGAEDSSTGEYITADDGYEADIEVPGRCSNNTISKKNSPLGPVVEPRGHANAHPALCSLAIDLLIHFSEQGLDLERGSIITGGLRRVAVTCRESASSCAALAASGTITKILNGFKNVFTNNDPRYRDLQHAALEVFTLLATQSISSTELVTYLSFFKVEKPPMLPLLEPLYHLVLAARPQPNFILSFPVQCDVKAQSGSKFQMEEHKNLEKAENLVNNFKKKHLAAGICSPWSVHAACLPIGSELAWPVWLHGCSASMWLRVERGSPIGGRATAYGTSPLLDSDSESLSDWGILSDNWSREDQSVSDLFSESSVVAGSVSPPTPTSIIHLLSIGFESLVLEMWLDLRSDKLILRLTRPDDKINRTISETSINGMLPSGRWHHLSLNFKDTVLNKHSAVVEVTLWVDGWREINARLPFDGLLVRKPGTTCILLGQIGSSNVGAWYLGNLMLFRCPVFTKERALYLTSLGPNYTNLADCILSTVKPDFAPLIASGALNGVCEVKYEGGKFDLNRRKSYGGTYLRHAVEKVVPETKIDWETVMDATNSHLGELQDNLLLCYEAQNPNVVHLYPQAIANPAAVVRNIFPGQPGFRVISAPEHRVSQQPPLSISPILYTRLESQQYRGLVPAAILVGGVPVFLYLFARVVELNSTEEEQALALSTVLHLVRSDSELLNQYRSNGGTSLVLRVLESSRCYAGRHILKAILDAACDSSAIIKDIGSGNHSIFQNCEAVITDPELIKGALTAWRAWAKYDTLNLLLQALLLLLRDQHSQREFNASQLNRVGIVDAILTMCKEHFMYEINDEMSAALDSNIGITIVELIRALMGAPPEFAHLVAITDYLVLVHQASETYVTHSRHNIYFMLPQFREKGTNLKTNSNGTSSDDSINVVENSKLNKALMNEQIQKTRSPKKKDRKDRAQSKDNASAGDDSGIAGSDGSNPQSNERQSTYADERRVCQGSVCEGLLLVLRDAVRVLPDSQVGSVLKHVLRAELLLVLANDPDARVRTALIKVVQTYLQRASDEEVNRFIKQKYFMHLGNQIALYPGSEQLVVALENLALRGPTLAAMPPLMAMIAKAEGSDANIARPIISFITDIIAKNINTLRVLLEQGLIESLAQALVGAAYKGNSMSLHRDIHVLFVAIASKLLELPGSHQMQAVLDLHVILDYVELSEKLRCRASSICTAIRDAQVALFDGELDILTTKMSNHSGFRLRSTASYLASASYLTSILTTSSEQSDGSRSSSYTSLHASSPQTLREPGKGELNDRFRIIVTRAVEFITTADASPSTNELQLTRRLFSILLHGLCSPLEKKHHWGSTWSVRPALRKYTARIMVWLLEPHQSINTRVYAVRSLMEEPKAREILSCILEVHPQMEQKFTVFFWDLLQKRDEMPSADARVCAELREALRVWDLAKGIEQASPEVWNDELALLRRDLFLDRDICIDNHPAILRIGKRFDALAKQLTESAMTITRSVVEEQNRERKVLMEQLKHTRALEAQAVARWRDIAKRLTHERAPWHFPESYPRSWELDPTEGPARVRIRLQRCHLNIDERFLLPEHQDSLVSSSIEAPLSYLFTSAREDANTAALIERLHTSEKIRKMSQARVVTPRAELAGEVLIGETCVYFVPDNPDMPLHTDIALGGFDLAVAGGTAWRLEDIRELHRRRYQLQERAIEIFLITGRTYLLAFNSSKERDEFATELSACNLPRRVPGDDLGEALALWRSGALTNWEYITRLNKLAGRSYNDLMQYPVFPFVLADYVSEKIDLNNPKIYRNFKRPMAVQDKKNEQHYINNYNYLKQTLTEGLNLIALNQGPFHYGSHYSNSGTVLHFLVRLPPFTSMFLCYQDNNFDIPDRTFHALATTWRLTSCDSTTDVKELIPEFFYLPEFLLNTEGFNFGVRQNGNRVSDVELPKWCAGDARLFILAHRVALESDIVREVLPYWIDLVFGFRQTGRPAVEAINVFHPATYYGFDVEQIADPLERQAWETMVRTYGQTPAQLFRAAHPLVQNLGNVTLSSQKVPVIEGISGIKWGNYVGAPSNEPVLCWKHKHRTPLASLIPLATGDVFGLPNYTTLLLGYTKEKGGSMLSGMSVLGAALASWNGTDGVARLKCKKEQPPRPLIKSLGLDPITTLGTAPDCGQLWIGHLSGRITVHTYTIGTTGKIEFSLAPATVLLAHRNRVTVISLSRVFSIACSGDGSGVIAIWDLNSLTYVRSVVCDQGFAVHLLCISETLGDVAATYEIPTTDDTIPTANQSEMRVYTVNARAVGSVLSRGHITALCYSNAPEGVSVNVIATGLDNGVIRLWSSWDLRLVREITSNMKGCGAIIAVAWALDQHHLYAVTEDSTVLIWEGSKRLSNGTPKFVNLTSL